MSANINTNRNNFEKIKQIQIRVKILAKNVFENTKTRTFQILLIYMGMKGYLDVFEVSIIGQLKESVIKIISRSNIFVSFEPTKKINNKVFDFFVKSATSKFKSC